MTKYIRKYRVFIKDDKIIGSRTTEGDINILWEGKRQKGHRVAYELENGEFKDKYAYKEFKENFNKGYFERGNNYLMKNNVAFDEE